MSDPQNTAVLALLSVLEQRATKKGRKSLVEDVLRVLSERGASEDLVAEIAALKLARNTGGTSAPRKAKPEPRRDGKTSAKAKGRTDPKPAGKGKAKAKTDAGLAA